MGALQGVHSRTVARIDPQRGTVQRQSVLGATSISAGAGGIWVADNDRSIWRVDGSRPQRIGVGAQPQDVAATSDGVWVADFGDQTAVRVDPTSRRVVARTKLGHQPVAVATGGGVVGVAVAQ